MSFQEVQVEQRREKVGLKRKLTGPPRLLLGKFRAKTQGENQTEAQTDDRKNSKGSEMDSPKSQRGNTADDDSPSIAMESFQNLTAKLPKMKSEHAPAVALEVCSTSKKSEAEGEVRDDGNTVKEWPKKRSRRWFWALSTVCIRRRRRRSGGERGADEPSSRDAKTSRAGDLLVDDPAGPSEDREATILHYQGDAVTEGKGGFSDATGSTLKRLVTFDKRKKPKGAHSEPAVQSGSEHQLHPKASFRKKIGLFFKRGSKNSHTSAENRGTTAPLDEETMGLPLRGQVELSVPEGDCSEAPTTSGGHLAVSVEVSALGQGRTEERSPAGSSDRADSCGSPVGLRTIAEEFKNRRCCKDEPDSRTEWRLKSDLPSKSAGGLPPLMEETSAAEKDLDWSPDLRANLHKDGLKESDAASPVDGTYTENDRIPENTLTEDVMGVGHFLRGIALESCVQDPLTLNGIDCMGHLSRDAVPMDPDIVVTNGPMGSPLEDLHLGGRPLLNNLPYCESGPRNCEALLAQTASSLVQAAVKAALDQLASEVDAAAASVHQGAQACL